MLHGIPLLALLLITTTAVATSPYEYTVGADNTAVITRYTGTEAIVELPAELDGHTVSGVADGAFADLPITAVTVPTSVTEFTIGERVRWLSSADRMVGILGVIGEISDSTEVRLVYASR